MGSSRTGSGPGRPSRGAAGWLARLAGAVVESVIRSVQTAVFVAGAVAWVVVCAVAGAVFGVTGFAVAAVLLLAHVLFLVIRAGRVHYARQREAGVPVSASGDLREGLGCIAAVLVLGLVIAGVIMLGVTLFEWVMTR